MTAVAEAPTPAQGPPTAVTDEETGSRVYVHPTTGERFVSVTTVLSVIAKERLHYWTAKTAQEYAYEQIPRMVQSLRRKSCEQKGDDRCGICRDCVALDIRRAPDRLRDEAADRGKRVHAIAEHHTLAGEILPHADDIAPYVAQYLAWHAQFRPTHEASEMTVISRKHGYAGTLDAVMRLGWCPPKHANLIGLSVLVDIKTGKNVYPEAALQLAAYRHADAILMPDGTELDMPQTEETGLTLHIRPDNYYFRPMSIGGNTFAAFLNTLNQYRWQQDEAPAVISRAMSKPKKKEQES